MNDKAFGDMNVKERIDALDTLSNQLRDVIDHMDERNAEKHSALLITGAININLPLSMISSTIIDLMSSIMSYSWKDILGLQDDILKDIPANPCKKHEQELTLLRIDTTAERDCTQILHKAQRAIKVIQSKRLTEIELLLADIRSDTTASTQTPDFREQLKPLKPFKPLDPDTPTKGSA